MIKNNILIVLVFVFFCILIVGSLLIKNQQDNVTVNIKNIDENSKAIEGIEKNLIDSIKLDKWENFNRIQCKQDDAIEKAQVLKEVKEKIQKINKSDLEFSRNEDTILLRKSQTLKDQIETLVKFKVVNTVNERKCIQIIL